MFTGVNAIARYFIFLFPFRGELSSVKLTDTHSVHSHVYIRYAGNLASLKFETFIASVFFFNYNSLYSNCFPAFVAVKPRPPRPVRPSKPVGKFERESPVQRALFCLYVTN